MNGDALFSFTFFIPSIFGLYMLQAVEAFPSTVHVILMCVKYSINDK